MIYDLGFNIKEKKGFTLIELLIVIAIIGVLSSLLMANFIGIRERARDTQRKSDLRQLQSALEMYRSDSVDGLYPLTADITSCGEDVPLESTGQVYMKEIPCDPSGGGYDYVSDGLTYTITACLENEADSQAEDSNGGCDAPFVVENP